MTRRKPMNGVNNRGMSVLRSVLGLVLTLVAVLAVYTALDMRQAKSMAMEASSRAAEGMSIDDLLPAFSEKEYRIIKSSQEIIIVPKKGLGRYHCTVSHDGRKITGSKVDFMD
jgi:hypothetical protein